MVKTSGQKKKKMQGLSVLIPVDTEVGNLMEHSEQSRHFDPSI